MKRAALLIAVLLCLASSAYAQTAVPVPWPVQYLTSSGAPCSGCLLYSYDTGTLTPHATYVSTSGGTANTNPVVMDRNGRAEVFAETGVRYRMILKTPGGATIWDKDPIVGPASDSSSDQSFQQLNNVRMCDQFSGATAGEKIAACIADLPSTGGTADARGLEGTQVISSDIFSAVTKPVNIVLGAATFNISTTSTSPGNIRWTLGAASVLHPYNSSTLTINGSIVATPETHFTFSSGGRVRFSSNTTMSEFNLLWWGPPSDGVTDAQPLIQAAIDAVPNYAKLLIPCGQQYALANTVSIYNRIYFEFATFVSIDGSYNYNCAKFTWTGAAGGTVWTILHSANILLAGIDIEGYGADNGILIDGDPLAGTFTSTANTLRNVRVSGDGAASNSNWVGIGISLTATNNNEFMLLDHVTSTCNASHPSGTGLKLGNSDNSHGHVLLSSTFYYCQYGIYGKFGLRTQGITNFGSSTSSDLYVTSTNYPTDISFIDSENSAQILYLSNATAFSFKNCRCGSSTATNKGTIQFGNNNSQITIANNDFSGTPAAGGYYYDFRGASGLDITLLENRYADWPTMTKRSIGLTNTTNNDLIAIHDGFFRDSFQGIGIYGGVAVLNIGESDSTAVVTTPQGAALSVISNAITVSSNMHAVGSGLIKTINLPTDFYVPGAFSRPFCTTLLTGATPWTTDTTGNVLQALAPPANSAVTFCYNGTSWYPVGYAFSNTLTVGSSSAQGIIEIIADSGTAPYLRLINNLVGEKTWRVGTVAGNGSFNIYNQTDDRFAFSVFNDGHVTIAPSGVTALTVTTTGTALTGGVSVTGGASSTTITNVALKTGSNAVISNGLITTCASGGCALVAGATNSAGKLTTTTTGSVSIVVTFGNTWAHAPSCFATNETTANLLRAVSTTTTLTLIGTTVNGDTLAYGCIGN